MKEGNKKYFLLLLYSFLGFHAFSQEDSIKKVAVVATTEEKKDTLLGQVRYFFMATDNVSPFTDYYAHAIGAQAKYERRLGKKFRFAVGASSVYNLSSSDLAKNDTIAKRPNRYEVGLFNLQHPNQKLNCRLEDLYLQYTLPKGIIRLGNQQINTPFINPQDGRMRPTYVNGLYTIMGLSNIQIEGGLITGILPRSITHWHSIASSIGLYPQGINMNGTASNYGGHLSSNGIFITGISYTFLPGNKVKIWEQYVDKIFSTSLLQLDAERKLMGKIKLFASFQYTFQVKIGNGGSNRLSQSYFTSAKPTQAISAMTGLKLKRFDASFNYTSILKKGRYLMPREWGREPFFTFMPRERNEGFGDMHAFVIKTAYIFPKAGLKTAIQGGHFRLPDVKNAALNKYSMPSYNQLNAELHYTPTFAPKVDLQLLYAFKNKKGNTYQHPENVFNKVNVGLYNAVIYYNW